MLWWIVQIINAALLLITDRGYSAKVMPRRANKKEAEHRESESDYETSNDAKHTNERQ